MRPDLGSSGRKGPHTLPKEPARITPWVGAAGQSPLLTHRRTVASTQRSRAVLRP
jgi:hypothetical protein